MAAKREILQEPKQRSLADETIELKMNGNHEGTNYTANLAEQDI